MDFLWAFLVGGAFCGIGQILIDRTKLTPARILTGYVVTGLILSAIGLYGPIAEFAGAGATVPLTGFGHLLAKGVREAVGSGEILGAFRGGVTAASAGICASIVFGFLAALIFKTHEK